MSLHNSLPEEVAADLEEATNVLRKVQEVLRNEDLLFAAEGLRCVFHVLSRHAAQARRLAEVEAEMERAKQRHVNAYQDMDEVLECGLRKQVKMSRKIISEKARVRELEAKLVDAKSDASCERIKRKCAEGRTQEMKKAIARYLAEKKQPGSDRRAEFEALASLHALATTEASA